MTHSPTSLRLDSVSVHFGGLAALTDVSIEINPREVVGVIGPNGAGKTTLFNVLTGLVDPSAGSFFLAGKKRDWPKTHELTNLGIARTLQGVGLFSDLTVLENVLVGATHFSKNNIFKSLLGLDGASDRNSRLRAQQALATLGISDYWDHRADSLPYPISKRVALARALISEPVTLILDEPAGGLGKGDIEWLKEFILQIRSETSVLLVEHHMDVIMNVCDRIYVLNFGQLIAHGTPKEIRNNPEVVAAYLGNEASL